MDSIGINTVLLTIVVQVLLNVSAQGHTVQELAPVVVVSFTTTENGTAVSAMVCIKIRIFNIW